MRNLIVDSSIIVKWLSPQNEHYTKQADKVLQDAVADRIRLSAPQLARYEIGNAILKKRMEAPLALNSLATSYKLPVRFVEETPGLAIEAYKMAEEAGITYYDSAFTALAKQENAALITDNPKHQKKIKEVKVIPLKNYR